MAFKRYARSAFRKGRRIYKYARKNPRAAAAIASQALRMAKQMRGIINSEKMYSDVSFGSTTSPVAFNLQPLTQGDGAGNRTGNSILARSLYIRGYVNINPAVTMSTRLSVVLVQDLQQISDVTPSVTDIFTGTTPESQLRVGNTTNTAGRFKIMWRKNYTLIPNQRPTLTIDMFRKLYTHIKFNGATATDVQKNGLYLVFLHSEATNLPSINFNARLGYYDN